MKIYDKKSFHDDFVISYRVDAASLATGMSESHIKSLIKSGELMSYARTPKVRLILKKDLINYITNTEIEGDEDEN